MFKFSSKIILRTDVPRKDGTCLLCIQAFINKKRIVEPLSIYIYPVNFDPVKQMVVYSKEAPVSKSRIDEIAKLVDAYCERVYQIRTRFETAGKYLTREIFRQEFTRSAMGKSFIDFVREEIKLQQPDREMGTIRNYRKVLNKLMAFRNDILFGDLSYELLQAFENYLINQNLDVNTRWGVHKVVKKFINCAIAKGVTLENPYVNFKQYSAETETIFLLPEELKILTKLYMSRELVDHLQHVLQYFLFSCFSGGFRISDITRLTHDNITGGRITFFMYKNRRKKKKRISIVLNNSAQLLLTSHNGKLFQTYCDQITNRHLKEIARIAGIDKKITFHVARHTFATHFLMAGGKVEVLKDILGHSKIETTMRYVHIVDESKNEQLKTLDEKYLREMFGFNNLAMVI